MPNGHGGYVRYFHPSLLLLALLYLVARRVLHGALWPLLVAIPLAALVGERFAFHRHMWSVAEYGGAYASAEAKEAAASRYSRAAWSTPSGS